MTLSRPLRWLLAATLLATAWVALQDEPTQTPQPARNAAQTRSSTTRPDNVGARTGGASSAKAQQASQALTWPHVVAAVSQADTPWPDLSDSARTAWHVPPPPAPPAPMVIPKPKSAPAAPATMAAAPVVPPAPAFPYTLIGRFEEQGRNAALLQGPQGTLAAIANQTIDRNWRVNSVNESGLSVTWMPTGQTKDVGY